MATTPIQPISETLDELGEQLELLSQYLESENPEDKAMAEEIYQQLEPKLEKKIDGYVAYINRLKANREFRQLEAKRISSLAKNDEARITWLTEKLLGFMEQRIEQLGEQRGRKLEGLLCKVSLCQNGGQPQVWINSELAVQDFPAEYVLQLPQLNTQKLKEDVLATESGELCDEQGRMIAKVLPRGKHIRLV